MSSPEIYIISDSADSIDHMIFENIDTSEGPYFTIKEVAGFFFGRSTYWLRFHERLGNLVLNGESVGSKRTEANHRVYDLKDIEFVAYALLKNGVLNLRQFRLSLASLRIQGQIWNLLPGEITGIPNF